jgi:hypothetical protein
LNDPSNADRQRIWSFFCLIFIFGNFILCTKVAYLYPVQVFDDGYFSKKPWTQFSGASRHIPVKILNISSHRQIHLLLRGIKRWKKGWKKKKNVHPTYLTAFLSCLWFAWYRWGAHFFFLSISFPAFNTVKVDVFVCGLNFWDFSLALCLLAPERVFEENIIIK